MDQIVQHYREKALVNTVTTRTDQLTGLTRRTRRATRHRLQHLDALSARLAELQAIHALLNRAAQVVSTGWLQGAWFLVDAPTGPRAVTAYDLRLALELPVSGACLVGAIVQGAGGPAAVRSQLVQRTLDLAWHTLREDPACPVRWSPGPRVRMMMLLELTHWNDDPLRTQGEVLTLLQATQHTADLQRDLCHAERATLTGISAGTPS